MYTKILLKYQKNLVRYKSENNFVGSKFLGRTLKLIVTLLEFFCKFFDILAVSLSVLLKNFDDLTKLLSDLYLAKLLDTLAKSFSP